MRKKTQYIVVNEIYKTIYCGYPQKRAWKIITGSAGGCSPRGELEITSVNNVYLEKGELKVQLLGRGFAWLDTGTPDALNDAVNFVATFQKRQGLYISCIEEIAYKRKFIDRKQLLKLAEPIKKTEYGKYLIELAEEKQM